MPIKQGDIINQIRAFLLERARLIEIHSLVSVTFSVNREAFPFASSAMDAQPDPSPAGEHSIAEMLSSEEASHHRRLSGGQGAPGQGWFVF
jgi:hypothetical protein